MGRAIFGLLLGFAIVLSVAFGARTCLPKPGDDIEWLHREDVVVVQMTDVSAPAVLEIRSAEPVPNFTLYGDGTLIFALPSDRSGLLPTPLREASISKGDIRSLLEFFDKQGFFEFSYEQPRGSGSDFPTTYAYVNTKSAANAISVYGISSSGGGGDAESAQFRRLQRIRQRLDDLATDAAEGDSATFEPREVVLFVQRALPGTSERPAWPIEGIDLATVAPDSGIGELSIGGDEVPLVLENLTMATLATGGFNQGGQRYVVWYRPVLPYEENFPEFDPPTP